MLCVDNIIYKYIVLIIKDTLPITDTYQSQIQDFPKEAAPFV